jgi:hypothetical protein
MFRRINEQNEEAKRQAVATQAISVRQLVADVTPPHALAPTATHIPTHALAATAIHITPHALAADLNANIAARDHNVDRPALRLKLKDILKGQFVSIVLDGATTKHVRRTKVHAIMVYNSRLRRAALLDIVFEEASTAVDLAAEIRRILAEFEINIRTQVTSIVGDNASLNDKLARELRVPRFKCIPHALHLVFNAFVRRFTLFCVVVRGVSRFITQGGGTKRARDLEALGVNVAKLRCVETKWYSQFEVAEYLASPLKEWKAHGVLRVVAAYVAEAKREAGNIDLLEMEEIDMEILHGGPAPAAAARGWARRERNKAPAAPVQPVAQAAFADDEAVVGRAAEDDNDLDADPEEPGKITLVSLDAALRNKNTLVELGIVSSAFPVKYFTEALKSAGPHRLTAHLQSAR